MLLAVPPASVRGQDPYVLFMGNSISYSRAGVDTAVMAISAAMGDSIVAEREMRGSSTIIDIWNDRNVLAKVQANHYTHVVLQPYVGDLSCVQYFASSCDTIFPQIQATGARVALYLSWPFAASVASWDSVEVVAYYDSIAAVYDLDVVPVGPSFIWWHLATGVRMYDDHVHPSPMAQYLAGSFFYTYLMQRSPSGIATYTTYELGSLQAQKMYDQAAATLLSSATGPRSGAALRIRPAPGTSPWLLYPVDLRGRQGDASRAAGLYLGLDGVRLTVGGGSQQGR